MKGRMLFDATAGGGGGGTVDVSALQREISRLTSELSASGKRVTELETQLAGAQGELSATKDTLTKHETEQARRAAFEAEWGKLEPGKRPNRDAAWAAFDRLPKDAAKAAEDASWAIGLVSSAGGGAGGGGGAGAGVGTVIPGQVPESGQAAPATVDMNAIIRERAGVPVRSLA